MLTIILPSHNEPKIHDFLQEVERHLPALQIIVSCDRQGHGKGWAIRQAIPLVTQQAVCFLDGDGDIKARMLFRLLPFLDDFEAVVGTKRIAHKHLSRRIITFFSRIYIQILFGLSCDTQTGIKLFRTDALRQWETDGFLFDVELLHQIKKNGGRIIEVPIEAEIRERMTWKNVWETFLESLALKSRLLSPVKR